MAFLTTSYFLNILHPHDIEAVDSTGLSKENFLCQKRLTEFFGEILKHTWNRRQKAAFCIKNVLVSHALYQVVDRCILEKYSVLPYYLITSLNQDCYNVILFSRQTNLPMNFNIYENTIHLHWAWLKKHSATNHPFTNKGQPISYNVQNDKCQFYKLEFW